MPSRYIRPGSGEYLDCLTHLFDPPDGLWARGPARLGSAPMIGIVGTRKATDYGRRMAYDLAFDLAGLGWAIVSGLARGIDTAAHRGALAAGGSTIAVLGCGVDRVYPKCNERLYREISRRGLLLSEYSPQSTPRRFHFPHRNRIVAALSRAVVVAQAGRTSGALITAGQALDLGREVLAVPGPADRSVSRGVHQLLREGAALVETAGDVLRALGLPAGEDEVEQPTLFDARDGSGVADHRETDSPRGPADRVRSRLTPGPAGVAELAGAAGLGVSETLAMLCRMEMGGLIRSIPGHRFELVTRS